MTREPRDHPELPVTVVLKGCPLDVGQQASDHYAEVVREFALLVSAGDAPPGSVPARVAELITELQALRELGSGFETERDEALAAGETVRDLVLEVDERVFRVCQQLEPLLDEVDDYSRDESVLALPPTAAVVAYRHWYFGQIFGQVAGAAPEPWTAPS